MMRIYYFIVLLLVCSSCAEQNGKVQKAPADVNIPKDYNPEANLKDLGIQLSTPSAPVANFVNAVRVGNLIFLSGKGPIQPNGDYITGKVGADLSIEEGYRAAKLTAINQLSVLKHELGDLNKVKRIVKVLGMVNAVSDFTEHQRLSMVILI